MELDTLIQILSQELKLPTSPQKDKNGVYPLDINPSTTLTVKALDPGVFFHAKIVPLPKEGNKEALFIHLMKGNLLGQGTGGSAIGIDPSETFFTLSESLAYEVPYKVFHEKLEDFLNYIDYWKEEIPKLSGSFL